MQIFNQVSAPISISLLKKVILMIYIPYKLEVYFYKLNAIKIVKNARKGVKCYQIT